MDVVIDDVCFLVFFFDIVECLHDLLLLLNCGKR